MAARRGSRRAAEEPGGRVLGRLRERLPQGWPAGLTVLHGEDLYHLDKAQRELLDSLVPQGASDFALTVYGEDKVDVGTVVAASRSAGMFATRRVVLVRDCASLDGEPDALETYAQSPPPDSYLLIRAPALDLRRKLHKVLHQSGQLLTFGAGDPHDLGRNIADVNAICEEKGLRLDREACAFLAQVCAGDLYRVASELDKLAALGGSAAPLGLAQVRDVAASGGLLTGWEVANAVTVRDAAAALVAARRLVESGEEPLRIVGGLAYRSRVLLQAKAMQEARRPPQAIVSATRAWAFADDLRRGLASYSLDDLLRFPSFLLEADRTLKSRAIAPGAVLEALVRRMTGSTGESA